MKTQIIADVVLSDQILKDGVCLFSDGVIEYVGAEKQAADQTIEAKDCYLMAGFVDIHCHGGKNLAFIDATTEQMREISEYYLHKGTTTLVPTTSTDEMPYLLACMDTYKALLEKGENLTLEGFHLEGPFLNAEECGAQDTSRMQNPTMETMDMLLTNYPFLTRISAAPEIEGAMECGKYAHDHGIVMAVAHSAADFDTVIRAKEYGYRVMTHLYSCMRSVTRKNAYRVAGAVEAGLYDDDLIVEVIADGKHLPVPLLKLIYKCKGADRICLITDAIRLGGMPDGTWGVGDRLATGAPIFVEDGVAKLPDRHCFAGSVATMDRLVRVMHFDAGFPLTEVSKMSSATPAKTMGLLDRGSIESGKRADLVIMDRDLQVKSVFFKGQLVEA